MHRTAHTRGWWGPAVVSALLMAACGDDGVAVTDGVTESSSGSSTGDTTPTTTNPPTTGTSTTDTPTTGTSSTTDTTTGTTGTTGSTTDTTTDTTTGNEVAGKSVSQTVNGGTVASSTNFRMVFTLGQPTQSQGTYTSDNFRLQGGLIGANGNPP